MMVSVVVLCAGKASRFNYQKNKVLLPLGDKPVFMHSVQKFLKFSDDIIVVGGEEDLTEIKTYYDKVEIGGKNRQDSVYQGIKKAKYERVLIHDGARPFVSEKEIKELIDCQADCAYLGVELVNSIKLKAGNNSLNRTDYVEALTPQIVNKTDYIAAYERTNTIYTDDVSLIQKELNKSVEMVLGLKQNFKITTFDDYELALKIINVPRVGHSWDCHKLVEGRDLILGGIQIPFTKGLLGHSDADALLHAISESLLGALALGDLGTHFPDNDPRYKGIDSKVILKECYQKVLDKGYVIVNIDTMIYAEKPKMKDYIPLMIKMISGILSIAENAISIKATTYEKMDAIGRGEAIACESYCVIVKKTV